MAYYAKSMVGARSTGARSYCHGHGSKLGVTTYFGDTRGGSQTIASAASCLRGESSWGAQSMPATVCDAGGTAVMQGSIHAALPAHVHRSGHLPSLGSFASVLRDR